MSSDLRYEARYRDGYYVVIDTQTGDVIPPPAGHYKRYRDGYLWADAAASMADQYNRELSKPAPPADDAPVELPAKRWKYRGLGRFVVGQQTGDTFDIYRGARTLDGARRARREVSHWAGAVIYDQATDRLVAR